MPRLKSRNDGDKQIPKGPYWDYLRQRMREMGVSSTVYNLEMQRVSHTQALAAPFYGDLFRVCRLAGVRGGDVFGEIGIDLCLSDEDKEFLQLADMVPDAALKKIMEHMQILDWGWYKTVMVKNAVSPYDRLNEYFDHASPPITENQSEYRLKNLSQMNADAKVQGLDQPTMKDMARYYVSKVTVSRAGLAIPVELIPCIAEMCGVSARWLCGYKDEDSFFGYKPLAESLYDFWKVHNTTNQYIIKKALTNILERI